MANTVELEEILGAIYGLDAEVSHLRASQLVPGALGLANQASPSDIINYGLDSSISVELEFGGIYSNFWMGLITYTVQFIFDDFAGGGVNPAPLVTPVTLTLPAQFYYSGAVTVPAGYLTPGRIYKVGAIVRAGLGNPLTTIYKGFIEGLVLSDTP